MYFFPRCKCFSYKYYVLIQYLITCISAVGQFKKQFAYLADNGGKSGPVTDRKHASVPR